MAKSAKEIVLEQKLKEIQLQQKIAEAEQATALANQNRLSAQFPTGQAKPLKGEVTTDANFGYLAEISAYHAMSQKADEIATGVVACLNGGDKILVVDSLDICAPDVLLLQIKNQIDFWRKKMASQLGQVIQEVGQSVTPTVASMAAITVGTAILSSLADIAGFFQVDYNIKGRKVEIGNAALHALVAGKICKKTQKVDVLLQGFHRIKSSDLVNDFERCTELRGELAAELAVLTDKLESDLKGNVHAKSIAEQTKSILRSFDEFNKSATSVPEGGTLSPMAQATIRAHLDEQRITHVLYLAVSSAGGESITKQWLWTTPKISFLGAGAYTYVLATCDGKIVAADTIVGTAFARYQLNQGNSLSFH